MLSPMAGAVHIDRLAYQRMGRNAPLLSISYPNGSARPLQERCGLMALTTEEISGQHSIKLLGLAVCVKCILSRSDSVLLL